MSLGHIGQISLEHIDPDVLGGVSYIETWYKSAHPFNYVNYITHNRDRNVYIKYGHGNRRAKVFVEEL